LIAKSREEIAARNRDLDEEQLNVLASQIATAALRFFMVKATTSRMIAFDFDEALSFEGDSGPYLQYSAVRARNIRRRLAEEGLESEVDPATAAALPAELWTDDLWDLALSVAMIPDRVRQAGETLEPSLVARHALDLALTLSIWRRSSTPSITVTRSCASPTPTCAGHAWRLPGSSPAAWLSCAG
jgi:arginyl-tRNA synthetase